MRLFRDRSDLLNEAREIQLLDDNKELKENQEQLNNIIRDSLKVEQLLSEPGWKTLEELFVLLYKRTEYKIRNAKDAGQRDLAVADQKAVMALWNVLRDKLNRGENARRRLNEIASEERSEGGLPNRLSNF